MPARESIPRPALAYRSSVMSSVHSPGSCGQFPPDMLLHCCYDPPRAGRRNPNDSFRRPSSSSKIFSTSFPGKWENLYSDLSGKIEGKRRRGRQRMKWLDDITDSMDMNLGGLWEMVKDRDAWRAVVHEIAKVGHDTATEQVSENKKLSRLGTLLMVQWLRFCTPSAGAQLSIPIQGTRSCMPQLKIAHLQQRSYMPQLRPSTAKLKKKKTQ